MKRLCKLGADIKDRRKLIMLCTALCLLSTVSTGTHRPVIPTKFTTIGGRKYPVLSLNSFHAFSTSDLAADLLLFPVAEVPANQRIRINTSKIDSYFIKLGTRLNCHRRLDKGLAFDGTLCCSKPVFEGEACADQAPPYAFDHLQNGLEAVRDLIVKDDNGEEFLVVSVVKTPYCPNLSGTRSFPTTPVPYGIRVSDDSQSRVADLLRCALIAILILVPTAYLIDFKEFWSSVTSLS